ncbi:MAG: hypothetical protein HY731_06935, partial [Candidatus Tectomicrobia bacterium]|nr:hypothetical protein [Candidatus Tectomicrobia bacterium]
EDETKWNPSGGPPSPTTSAVAIECPTRRTRGLLFPIEEIRKISALCRTRGIKFHLDGARIFIAAAAADIEPQEYAQYVDTLYFSICKGLPAPGGGVLVGPKTFIEKGKIYRRMFGGAPMASHLNAALALSGLHQEAARWKDLINQGRALIQKLADLDAYEIELTGQESNLIPLAARGGLDLRAIVQPLADRGISLMRDIPESTVTRTFLAWNETLWNQSLDTIVEAFRAAAREV